MLHTHCIFYANCTLIIVWHIDKKLHDRWVLRWSSPWLGCYCMVHENSTLLPRAWIPSRRLVLRHSLQCSATNNSPLPLHKSNRHNEWRQVLGTMIGDKYSAQWMETSTSGAMIVKIDQNCSTDLIGCWYHCVWTFSWAQLLVAVVTPSSLGLAPNWTNRDKGYDETLHTYMNAKC